MNCLFKGCIHYRTLYPTLFACNLLWGFFCSKQIKVGHRTEAKDGRIKAVIILLRYFVLIDLLINLQFCFNSGLSGINRTALREIKLLQEISHPNIIGVSLYMNTEVTPTL